MIRACLASSSGGCRVGHHQEADRLQPERPGQPEVLDRDVGLGAVCGDAHDRDTDVAGMQRMSSIVPMPGTISAAILACVARLDGGLHQQPLVGQREAVVERRAAEAVAVGDLDHRHAGGVERATMSRTCRSVNWWLLAWEPSRSDVSVMRTSSVARVGHHVGSARGRSMRHVLAISLADLRRPRRS